MMDEKRGGCQTPAAAGAAFGEEFFPPPAGEFDAGTLAGVKAVTVNGLGRPCGERGGRLRPRGGAGRRRLKNSSSAAGDIYAGGWRHAFAAGPRI